MLCFPFKGSPAHVSTPFRAGHTRPRYPASYPPATREEFPALRPAVPAAFQPPAFASWAPCPARRSSAPITVGLPPPARIPGAPAADPGRVYTFRTRETQTGPGALFTPGMTVFAGHREFRGRRLPPLNGRSLAPRSYYPTRDVLLTRHQQEFPDSRPIPAFPFTCDRHGWIDGPWAFPRASHPTDQGPATHVTVGTGRTQTRSYVFDIRRTSSTSSLTACDLVSQPHHEPATGTGRPADPGSDPLACVAGGRPTGRLLTYPRLFRCAILLGSR